MMDSPETDYGPWMLVSRRRGPEKGIVELVVWGTGDHVLCPQSHMTKPFRLPTSREQGTGLLGRHVAGVRRVAEGVMSGLRFSANVKALGKRPKSLTEWTFIVLKKLFSYLTFSWNQAWRKGSRSLTGSLSL